MWDYYITEWSVGYYSSFILRCRAMKSVMAVTACACCSSAEMAAGFCSCCHSYSSLCCRITATMVSAAMREPNALGWTPSAA